MRKLFPVFFLALLILSVSIIPVSAVDAMPEPASPEASAYHTRDNVSSQIHSEEAKSGEYLIEEWYSRIRDLGNNKVELYGWTRCNQVCEEVGVELQLQQWNGAAWLDLGTYRFAGLDTDYTWGQNSVSISPGNSYRVRSCHRAEDGTLSDQTTAVTEAIYID